MCRTLLALIWALTKLFVLSRAHNLILFLDSDRNIIISSQCWSLHHRFRRQIQNQPNKWRKLHPSRASHSKLQLCFRCGIIAIAQACRNSYLGDLLVVWFRPPRTQGAEHNSQQDAEESLT